MNYFGITAKTVEWILANNNLLSSFKEDLRKILHEKSLAEGVVAAGPIRITSADDNLMCFWNNEYLTGTDTEEWAFVKLVNDFGLLSEDEIYEEVVERFLSVISLRMQNFNLPEDRYIHRVVGENIHTCLAGRGSLTRKYSLGWYEDKITVSTGSYHSMIIIGPSNIDGLTVITNALNKIKPTLPKLLEQANDMLVKSRQRPILENKYFAEFRNRNVTKLVENGMPEGDQQMDENKISHEARFTTLDWTYDDWIKPDSPLTQLQREIWKSDTILKQPLRIIGAAGTGKSLLMQLLTIKRLRAAQSENTTISILYVVHNNEIAITIKERFKDLGAEDFLVGKTGQTLIIQTLFEYAYTKLALDETMLMDRDASQTKMFQRLVVIEYIEELLEQKDGLLEKSNLIKKVAENYDLRELFADIVVSEIGIGIKGRDLSNNKRKYIESEKALTRFHGILNEAEREFVYNIFEKYYERVTLKDGLLDSDDVAITFLGTLKTPLWLLQRRKEAFDFVFIDETQLFNQNERMVFRFLTKSSQDYLPIAIALDEAQELRGSSNAGFGALGIEHLVNENLPNIHRSTKEISQLAFFVIQNTTDLFGTDFPDFTTTTTVQSKNGNSSKPKLTSNDDLSIEIKREITSLRRKDVRQIAIVIHAERYFQEIVNSIKEKKENVVVAEKRGEPIDPKKPIIYITRPELVGGQEFDAVIAVGLEHGVTPPLIDGHEALKEALEQQSLREMYLSFTRAKTYLTIVNHKNSSPTSIIQKAIDNNIIDVELC